MRIKEGTGMAKPLALLGGDRAVNVPTAELWQRPACPVHQRPARTMGPRTPRTGESTPAIQAGRFPHLRGDARKGVWAVGVDSACGRFDRPDCRSVPQRGGAAPGTAVGRGAEQEDCLGLCRSNLLPFPPKDRTLLVRGGDAHQFRFVEQDHPPPEEIDIAVATEPV